MLGSDKFLGIQGTSEVAVLKTAAEVGPWIGMVISASDSNKKSLGFWPRDALAKLANRGRLYVLTSDSKYAGHLLFETKFPRLKILQMYVGPTHRKTGNASLLLNTLVLEHRAFASIIARVAEDMHEENIFWEKQGFYVLRIDDGGKTTGRKIVVRCKVLPTPQLFAIPQGVNFESAALSNFYAPNYLLDLNVLFDAGLRRTRNQAFANLLAAERQGMCKLFISEEIVAELNRTATIGKSDPMIDFVSIFPFYPVGKNKALEQVVQSIIFPLGPGDQNGQSDVRHVCCAITNELTGIVSSDTAILNAAHALQIKFNIQVLSLESFGYGERDDSALDSFEFDDLGQIRLHRHDPNNDQRIANFLNSVGSVSSTDIKTLWLSVGLVANCDQLTVSLGHDVVGYMRVVWSHSELHPTKVYACIAERECASTIARILLSQLTSKGTIKAPTKTELVLADNQSTLRTEANLFGFYAGNDQRTLRKFSLNSVLTATSWPSSGLIANLSMQLPVVAPTFRGWNQQIELRFDEKTHFIDLYRLESLLAPALLCLTGRRCLLTPISRRFAERLLGHEPQFALFRSAEADLHAQRNYYSSPKTLRAWSRGALVLFYESGKHGAVVAIARVVLSRLRKCDDIDQTSLKASALTKETLTQIGSSKMKTETTIDNVFVMNNPVKLSDLRKIGIGMRPNDLITTRAIPFEAAHKILSLGFDHG